MDVLLPFMSVHCVWEVAEGVRSLGTRVTVSVSCHMGAGNLWSSTLSTKLSLQPLKIPLILSQVDFSLNYNMLNSQALQCVQITRASIIVSDATGAEW